MSGLRLMIALAAGVTATSVVDAKPAGSSSKVKTAKVSKLKAKTTAKAKLKAKSKRKKRTAVRPRGNNMPRGFVWPPSPAMIAAGRACEAELDALGLDWRRAEPEGRINAPVVVDSLELGGVTYTSKWRKGPHKLDCQLARTLVAIGPDLRAIGVREVVFGSIYRWSNVRTQGTERPYLSRHALGLAMDIVEFVDDDGRVANVARDYLSDDALLIAIEDLVNASGKFRIVLTPRNDPKSHDDHFHIEANPDYSP